MMRTMAVVLFAAMLAVFGFGGGVVAQDEAPPDEPGGRDPFEMGCDEWASRADAQTVLDDGRGDPAKLDPDGDGVACYDSGPAMPDDPGAIDPFTLTCDDIASQTDAQTLLDDGRGDPAKLDADGDGIACYDSGPTPPDEPTLHGLNCDELPEGSDAQAALESGIADADLLDPDSDGIACNHDDAPVDEADGIDDSAVIPTDEDTADDGVTTDQSAAVETESPSDEGAVASSDEEEVTQEAPASVVVDTDADAREDEAAVETGSVTLPSTGVGPFAPTSTMPVLALLTAIALASAATRIRRTA